MEWSDLPYSPFDEDLYGLLSPSLNSKWTSEENGMFENALFDGAEEEQEDEEEEVDVEGEAKNVVAPSNQRTTTTRRPRRKSVPWTEEEHQLFLMGLNKYGKGDWRSISRYYVINKTPTQVASHAQKFFRRRNTCTPPDRRRPSIHDVQTVNLPATQPVLPFSSSALIAPLHHNFNGGATPILHQNRTFMPAPPPIGTAFPPAANYASTSCFLMKPNWG